MSRTARRRDLRWRFAVVGATALGAAAALVPSTAATSGKPAKPAKQRPFIGFVQGFVTVEFAPGFPAVRDTFGGRCSVPSDWIAHWSGTGRVHPTGSLTASGSDCDRVDLATGNLVYGDGVISEYDKHGDYIYGTYTNGHGTLGGTISDDWTIVGGTGRFAGATGQGTETFDLLAPPSFTTDPQPFINPWTGVISYAGNKPDH